MRQAWRSKRVLLGQSLTRGDQQGPAGDVHSSAGPQAGQCPIPGLPLHTPSGDPQGPHQRLTLTLDPHPASGAAPSLHGLPLPLRSTHPVGAPELGGSLLGKWNHPKMSGEKWSRDLCSWEGGSRFPGGWSDAGTPWGSLASGACCAPWVEGAGP